MHQNAPFTIRNVTALHALIYLNMTKNYNHKILSKNKSKYVHMYLEN